MLKLEEIAETARKCHTSALSASGIHETRGSCLYACIIIVKLLAKFIDCSPIIRGGNGEGDGGYLGQNNRMYGHYWVEVKYLDVDYIIDITADQFGDQDFIITELNSKKARFYIKGDQEIVDSHVLSCCP